MATTSDYLTQLQNDKQALVDNLNTQGVEASSDETFTTLVPKVLDIEGGGGGTKEILDRQGLKSIGYDDETIEWYNSLLQDCDGLQDSFILSDEDKSYYGVVTVNNLSNYKSTIKYLPFFSTYLYAQVMSTSNSNILIIPKIDFSYWSDISNIFENCYSLISIPRITLSSNATKLSSVFQKCYNLRAIPLIDTSNIRLFTSTFYMCYSLKTIPLLNTSSATGMGSMFYSCYSLETIPQLDTSNVTNFYSTFYECPNLTSLPRLNFFNAINVRYMLNYCYKLTNLGGFQNLGQAYDTTQAENYSNYGLDLSMSPKLTHDSLMNVINDLYDIASKGCNRQQLVLGETNLAKLSSDEIAIATNKGWNVVQ